MTHVSIDLEAERAQSRQRRDLLMLEHRARMLLEGQWHLDAKEINAAIAERYPQLEGNRARALLQAALDLQKQEAPRRIPLESIDPLKPEPEEPQVTPVAEEKQHQVTDEDGTEMRQEPEAPASDEKPRQEEVMPRSNAVAQVTDENDRDWREDAQEALEEVEVGEAADATLFRSLDYLRLEQEPDGAWTLSASMTFTDVARARRVLARLVA